MEILSGITEFIIGIILFSHHEILLFALAGLLIGGFDDFLMDIFFLVRHIKRRLFVYTRHKKMTGATLPLSNNPGKIAIFVPAWNEANVIGRMLRGCLDTWRTDDFSIFVGTYPNDPATIHAVADIAADDGRIRQIILPHAGGTTKADCLNHIWAAMLREEAALGVRFKAIVLHDAEQVGTVVFKEIRRILRIFGIPKIVKSLVALPNCRLLSLN